MIGTWPEQNAIGEWKKQYGVVLETEAEVALKECVTAYRLEIQSERDSLQLKLDKVLEVLDTVDTHVPCPSAVGLSNENCSAMNCGECWRRSLEQVSVITARK